MLRQVIIFITAGWLILLGVLGMAPIPRLVINDKALHFFGVRVELGHDITHRLVGVLMGVDGLCDFSGLLHH